MSTDMPHDFERELTLKDLLCGINKQRLQAALECLTNTRVVITDSQGEYLLGTPEPIPDHTSLPLYGELEVIGQIAAKLPQQQLQAAADLLTLLLRSNARYLMASDLHIQTQQADFAELQHRHTALQQSEQRYKTLSEHLEERVQEQVKTLESTQLKLYKNEKLASVGRLAAGVAHEINNPIGFIRSNLSTASNYLTSLQKIGSLMQAGADINTLHATWQREDMPFILEDMQDILNESINGTERIAAIVKDLKGFSHVNEAGQENADINLIIRQVCNVAIAEHRDKAEVQLDLGKIPLLRCHPGELGQVFLSLLMNAVDAATPVGTIQFRTRIKDQTLCIEVRDNGCGIPKSALPHIFDPFFTTKEIGKGMGLGLTVCRNIINAHQGDLTIKSQPGIGTLISINLPLNVPPIVTNQPN